MLDGDKNETISQKVETTYEYDNIEAEEEKTLLSAISGIY